MDERCAVGIKEPGVVPQRVGVMLLFRYSGRRDYLVDLLTIIATAFALSIDALAVSISNGIIIKELKFRHAFRIAVFFGLFQAIMPVLGWAAGYTFRDMIGAIDHWIALGLLSIIGIKMTIESRSLGKCEEAKDCQHLPTLLLMALATSIDALAAGISFAFLEVNIIGPVAIIGAVTFVVCLAGVYAGNRTGCYLKGKLELAGGLILIGIGIKIAVEHIVKNI
jgi:putative Mn2+ efflux pump MntP